MYGDYFTVLQTLPENKMSIFQRVKTTFLEMTWREHLLYWVLPISIGWILALMYFAGTPWMQNIVAPAFNRELGLLENLENILLLIVILISISLFWNAENFIMKGIILLCFFASVFMLLEEMDYGNHLINYYKGISLQEDPVNRNFHNQGKNTIKIMMWTGYAIIGLFILIMPHVKKNNLPFWIKNLTPSVKLHFTVISLLLVSRLPHKLKNMNFETNKSLSGNLSEFEEFVIYYIFFLFFYEMISKQRKATLKTAA